MYSVPYAVVPTLPTMFVCLDYLHNLLQSGRSNLPKNRLDVDWTHLSWQICFKRGANPVSGSGRAARSSFIDCITDSTLAQDTERVSDIVEVFQICDSE